jgi:glucans biosynthesis protein C
MQPSLPDRLHALDAVRAFALLLGVVLHAAHPYVGGQRWMVTETPSDTLAAVWYTIHMFRMPLFFLVAGFFGRMMVEKRGTPGFVRDRSRRILLPLVAGYPVVAIVTGGALVLGALVAGADLSGFRPPPPPPSSASRGWVASINLMHLWFLYYLVLFYIAALGVRWVLGSSFGQKLLPAFDKCVEFLMRGLRGPIVLALPLAAWYFQLKGWSPFGGFPAPFQVVPDAGALLTFGLFFGFGWLLQRQQPLLRSLEKRWTLYLALAVVAWGVCRAVGGWSPRWGAYLGDSELLVYALSYAVGTWSWTFAIIGIAMRYLSGYSAVRRYIADSSYWIYLMHVAALFFFGQVFRLFPVHWSVKYPLTISASLVVLFLTYHYLVRFTFIGATLNGRRQPPVNASIAAASP